MIYLFIQNILILLETGKFIKNVADGSTILELDLCVSDVTHLISIFILEIYLILYINPEDQDVK